MTTTRTTSLGRIVALEQLLVNLVINSRDAIEGTGSVAIGTMKSCPRTIVHDDPAHRGWFQVADAGSDISDDDMCPQSAGSIFVESTVGAGTNMAIALPSGPGTVPTD